MTNSAETPDSAAGSEWHEAAKRAAELIDRAKIIAVAPDTLDKGHQAMELHRHIIAEVEQWAKWKVDPASTRHHWQSMDTIQDRLTEALRILAMEAFSLSEESVDQGITSVLKEAVAKARRDIDGPYALAFDSADSEPTLTPGDTGGDEADDELSSGGNWNYRIREYQEEDGTPHYEIIEVYYDATGNPNGWAEAAPPHGDTITELRDDLMAMLEALELPVYLDAEGE